MALTRVHHEMLARNITVVQQVYAETKTYSAGNATTIPHDDSIPTSSEGTEFLTASITPTDADNYLLISGQFMGAGTNSPSRLGVAIFRDGGSDAIYATSTAAESNNKLMTVPFHFRIPAGSTAATTFKIRAGMDNGSTSMNGIAANRVFVGVALTCLQIEEVKA